MRWAEGSEQHYAMAELLRAPVSSVSRPGKPYLICHMQADDLQVAGQLQGSSRIAYRQGCDAKSSRVNGRNKGKLSSRQANIIHNGQADSGQRGLVILSNGQADSGQRGLVIIGDGQADSGQRGLVVIGDGQAGSGQGKDG